MQRPNSRSSAQRCALLLLLIAGCGGEETQPTPSEEGSESTASAPTVAAPDAGTPREGPLPQAEDFPVELEGPRAQIPGHPSVLPDWGQALRPLIDPENDVDRDEILAVRFERVSAALFPALFAGDLETAGAALADDYVGFRGLTPTFGAPRFDDGALRVTDADETEDRDEASRDLEAAIEALGESGWMSVVASGEVVAIAPLEDGLWSCELELRLEGELRGVPAMLDARLEAVLREDEDAAAPPLVRSLTLSNARLVEAVAPTFEDISGHVFGGLEHLERELLLGCGDYTLKVDRRQIPFRTGILGMALGDVNGDGLEDIYLSQIGGYPNRLLLHQPDGSVRDAGPEAGVDLLDTTRGALLADLDGDDDLDLAVGRTHAIVVFWNDGSGVFPGEPTVLGGPDNEPIYSISAGDPDRDGDLDLFGARYSLAGGEVGVPTPYHDASNGTANTYWRNEGERRFVDAGAESGLTTGAPRYTFIGLWDDFNGDSLLDLYVVNDFGLNELFLGDGEGKFREAGGELGVRDMAAGMGVSVADVELDGDLDLYITNMDSAHGLRATARESYRPGDPMVRAMHRRMAQGNSLLVQEEPGRFAEIGDVAGVRHGGWGWGGLFHDWNLDGLPDLYVPNGFYSETRREDVEGFFWRYVVRVTPPEPGTHKAYYDNWGAMGYFSQNDGYSYNGYERNHVYLNLGGAEFANVGRVSGIDFDDDSRVAARLDWDGDGRLDLLVVNRTAPRVRLVRNVHPEPGHRVALELRAANGGAGAVGARVRVERGDGKVVTRTIYAGEGLLGQSSYRLLIGLADSDEPVDVEVRWPDGATERFEGLAVDRGWKLVRGGESSEWSFSPSPFEGRGASALEANPRGVERCVLAVKLPLRSFKLPSASGEMRRLGDLPRRTKLVVFWDPESRTGEPLLRQLAALRPELEAAGNLVVPVSLSDTSGGEALLDELGFADVALRTTQLERLLLETILLEVLGSYDAIDAPLTLLLDRGSNLAALYFGAPRSEELLEDVGNLATSRPKDISTTPLSGGHWLGQPGRSHRRSVRALMMLGARELAEDLRDAQD